MLVLTHVKKLRQSYGHFGTDFKSLINHTFFFFFLKILTEFTRDMASGGGHQGKCCRKCASDLHHEKDRIPL